MASSVKSDYQFCKRSAQKYAIDQKCNSNSVNTESTNHEPLIDHQSQMLNPSGLDFIDISSLWELLIYVRYQLINETKQQFDLHRHYKNDTEASFRSLGELFIGTN